MSIEGTAKTEYASLSGKIHTFVVDKTLSISGACADAKATGEAIESAIGSVKEVAAEYATEEALEAVGELAEETARNAAVDSVATLVNEAISELGMLSTDEVKNKTFTSDKLLEGDGLSTLWSMIEAEDTKDRALANTKAVVETGSYVGTGGAITLTFNHKPQIIVISSMKNVNNSSGFMVLPRGEGAATAAGNQDAQYYAYASWGDKTVTVSGSNLYNPSVAGRTHYYAAITFG